MLSSGEYDTLTDGKHSRKGGFLQRFKFPIIVIIILIVAVDDDKQWDEQLQVGDVFEHLQKLQNIADENGGNRAANTSGIEYILSQLKKTNYEVRVQEFNFSSTNVVSASNITIYSPIKEFTLVYNQDYGVMGAGTQETYTVTDASVYLAVGYGCGPAAYEGIPPNSVVLVVRGNCTFDEKIAAAEATQPAVVIIYNEGNTPDRLGPFFVTVGNVKSLVLSTSYYGGQSLIGSNVSLSINTQYIVKTTQNIIADTKAGAEDRIIVVGSHLDSVTAGPGINDNGSGSSLNIALALLLHSEENRKQIKNKIRFCWFGAEELGLLGSHAYVNNLTIANPAALADISVNLNFDMIGSPNYIRGVYNGSSDSHIGSHVVQILFNNYYATKKLSVIPTPFNGRSDYGPFLEAGIPAGGLFTGAEEPKSISMRTIFGGLAGASYDPCYHLACDTIDNIDQGVLLEMSQGAAHVLQQLATASNLTNFLLTLPTAINSTSLN